MSTSLIPAAQYLRMSTEHQNYSLDHQAAAIQEFAGKRGYAISKTYSDAGRSGLKLRNRPGLLQLLRDVVAVPDYRAILVYDVSRWGRFQDVDESAYYEFICKSAGIPVVYCGEQFTNELTIPNAILKGLKRVMAAEYSRELSQKVYHGQRRMIEMGFKAGGTAPYGFRRFLLAANGTPKGVLECGETKALHGDRIILVPGPPYEVATVRRIFLLVARYHWNMVGIAQKLNDENVPYPPGRNWTRDAVQHILRDPKYTGCNVWGRTTCKLKTNPTKVDKSLWVTKDGAFLPLVSKALFKKANDTLRTRYWSDERLLEGLRQVLAEEGAITQEILERREIGPKYGAIVMHFGSLQKALKKVGYHPIKNYQDARAKGDVTQKLQRGIVKKLAMLHPDRITTHQHWRSPRPYLRLDNEVNVSVHICPCVVTRHRVYWRFTPRPAERGNVTLCCLTNRTRDSIHSMHLIANSNINGARLHIRLGGPWFRSAHKVRDLDYFCAAVRRVAGLKSLRDSRGNYLQKHS
jgi:DNA invertase Pin-like site-specific DNA recombinase